MTHPDNSPPTSSLQLSALVLPRQNLGPEAWAEPMPTWGWTELVLGLLVTSSLLGLAINRRRARLRREALGSNADLDPVTDAILTPSRRLIASSSAVRLALIAEFGPTWGSRTTEEIAIDPTLTARLGSENAAKIVAYLQRVDRAKFADEEFVDVNEWIDSARDALSGLKPSLTRRSV